LVLEEHAKSFAGAPLPLLACGQGHEHAGTILLFYQYQEPIWTAKQHKQVLKDVIALGQKHSITGRGRVAPEGLNCTLSGSPKYVRAFVKAFENYDKLFLKTDFKLTDGVLSKLFKSLPSRKTNELVAYGLSGERPLAPNLPESI
jgi:predicted sulfurtransferase